MTFLEEFLSTPLLEAKLWSTLAMLLLSLVCSYVPWALRSHYKNSKGLMSYLNCLAGGVVLGALLMHMIPDITHSHYSATPTCHELGVCSYLRHVKRGNGQINPFPSRRLQAHDKLHHDHDHGHHDHDHGHEKGCSGAGCENHGHDHNPHQDDHGNTPQNQGLANKDGKRLPDGQSQADHHHDDDCSHDHHQHGFAWGLFFAGVSFLFLLAIDRLFMHSHSHDHDHGDAGIAEKAAPAMKEKGGASLTSETCPASGSALSVNKFPCHHLHAQGADVECGGRIHSADPENDDCASCHSDDLVGGCHMDGLDAHSSRTQALVFVVALSMHSFLEGLGMASKNTQRGLLLYLISLFAHKWLEAFALGVNVMNATFSDIYAFGLVVFYALLTPLGIILGMLFESITLNSPHAELAEQLLNGLAVGSFMFVSCIEMIPPEFHKKTRHTPYKFIALVVGFLLMAGISALHHH